MNQTNDITPTRLYDMLSLPAENIPELVAEAAAIKERCVGNVVYLRGLLEYSNICTKNCYYCGIRCGNRNVLRYQMEDYEVVEAALYAHRKGFASLVIQAGERSDTTFTTGVARLLEQIMSATHTGLKITLSVGEQSRDTLRLWKRCGADRYLLRVESSSETLYSKIHPNNANHSYAKRIRAIEILKEEGYQVGSGVMIGLPFQTTEDLVNDLLFLQRYDIDMVGMGPYVEHEHTPLYQYRHLLLPKAERLNLTIKMVASLRILMKDINIAATTAMQTLADNGRERAVSAGANVIMPNLTPAKYRGEYHLYENKPLLKEDADDNLEELERTIASTGNTTGYGKPGDSPHYTKRQKNLSVS